MTISVLNAFIIIPSTKFYPQFLLYWRNYTYKHRIQDPFGKMRRRPCQTEDASSGTVVIVDH